MSMMQARTRGTHPVLALLHQTPRVTPVHT